ncbi:hypothetical protein [Mucilaginibacter sp. UR6-11]|uniref:hypothetical protein n=1 Tax=Mucilaginibacter sp. UR6-11 TaxID=1435644 RepID=UPI001E5D8517|nr:hypothetical protein [Mucilaginibacter sp. UR6-11]MCC8425912.1 hypothetical protein [Mucilaginibacter sp. UR6-11]
MKSVLFTIIMLLYSFLGYTQISKMYLNNKAENVAPEKATSYILIEKVGDSAYVAQQNDMTNKILLKGSYKDEMLTIPHGKFFYYNKWIHYPNIYDKQHADTTTYLEYAGFFLNGVKVGTWIDYDKNGKKVFMYTFVNNKVKGPFQAYNSSGQLIQKGNLDDNKKEGDWETYEPGMNKPSYTEVYLQDKLIKKSIHFVKAVPPRNFESYLKKALKKHMDSLNNVTVLLSINKEGKIDSVTVNKVLNAAISKAVINAFLNAPLFSPGLYDGQPVKQTSYFSFSLMLSKEIFIERENSKNVDIVTRHAESIGRGLNSIGLGTRLD